MREGWFVYFYPSFGRDRDYYYYYYYYYLFIYSFILCEVELGPCRFFHERTCFSPIASTSAWQQWMVIDIFVNLSHPNQYQFLEKEREDKEKSRCLWPFFNWIFCFHFYILGGFHSRFFLYFLFFLSFFGFLLFTLFFFIWISSTLSIFLCFSSFYSVC